MPGKSWSLSGCLLERDTHGVFDRCVSPLESRFSCRGKAPSSASGNWGSYPDGFGPAFSRRRRPSDRRPLTRMLAGHGFSSATGPHGKPKRTFGSFGFMNVGKNRTISERANPPRHRSGHRDGIGALASVSPGNRRGLSLSLVGAQPVERASRGAATANGRLLIPVALQAERLDALHGAGLPGIHPLKEFQPAGRVLRHCQNFLEMSP